MGVGFLISSPAFTKRIQTYDYAAFTPPGRCLYRYENEGKNYEIWKAPMMDQRCREVFDNMQILALFFIEGATLIDSEDEIWTRKRWDVYFL